MMSMVKKKAEDTFDLMSKKLNISHEKTEQLLYFISQNMEKISQLQEYNDFLQKENDRLTNKFPQNSESLLIDKENKETKGKTEYDDLEMKKKYNDLKVENNRLNQEIENLKNQAKLNSGSEADYEQLQKIYEETLTENKQLKEICKQEKIYSERALLDNQMLQNKIKELQNEYQQCLSKEEEWSKKFEESIANNVKNFTEVKQSYEVK